MSPIFLFVTATLEASKNQKVACAVSSACARLQLTAICARSDLVHVADTHTSSSAITLCCLTLRLLDEVNREAAAAQRSRWRGVRGRRCSGAVSQRSAGHGHSCRYIGDARLILTSNARVIPVPAVFVAAQTHLTRLSHPSRSTAVLGLRTRLRVC